MRLASQVDSREDELLRPATEKDEVRKEEKEKEEGEKTSGSAHERAIQAHRANGS